MSDDIGISQEELEEIGRNAAKAAMDEAAKAAAQRAYGQPAASGGGTPPSHAPKPGSYEAAEELVLGRLRQGDGLQDSKGKLAFNQWVTGRIKDAARAAVNDPSYRSFSRPGSTEDKKISDDRAAARKQRGGSL